MDNEAAILDSLRQLETMKDLYAQGDAAGSGQATTDFSVEVRVADFTEMTFEEQVKVDLQTDIMIGPHGAGLMHSVFMRDRGVLVELVWPNCYGTYIHTYIHTYMLIAIYLPRDSPLFCSHSHLKICFLGL